MLRLKIVRYSILIGSVLAGFVPIFSESIREKTIGRYDLRWSQEVNGKDRVHTIALRNNGLAVAEGLIIELKPNAPDAIVDFDTSSSTVGPYYSFSNALASAWSSANNLQLLKDPEKEVIRQVIDTHAVGQRLGDLHSAFDRILVERVKSAKPLQKSLDYLQRIAESKLWHERWHQNCAVNNSEPECAKIDQLIGNWEQTKDGFYSEAVKNWVGATGVVMQSQDSSDPKISLRLTLKPRETRYIRFHYSRARTNGETSVESTSGGQTILVNSVQLDSSFLSLLWDLHKLWVVAGGFVLVLVLLLLAPFIVPTQLLSTRKIFSIAALTDDHEFWKSAIERHRFFILEEFRELRRIYGPQLVIDSEQVLDYVRTRVSNEAAAGDFNIASQAALDGFISDELRIMLLTAQ